MKHIKIFEANNKPAKLRKRTLTYIESWHEMEKLIEAKFGYEATRKYWSRFMVDDITMSDIGQVRKGGIGHMNLYYFGPRPNDPDPEEQERAKTVFGWTEKTEQDKLFKAITHFIWDTLEPLGIDDVEQVYFKF